MTPEQFAYWLQGYAEIGGPTPTPEQWQIIKGHLALVFDKKTPDRSAPEKPNVALELSKLAQFPGHGVRDCWPPVYGNPPGIGSPMTVTC